MQPVQGAAKLGQLSLEHVCLNSFNKLFICIVRVGQIHLIS